MTTSSHIAAANAAGSDMADVALLGTFVLGSAPPTPSPVFSQKSAHAIEYTEVDFRSGAEERERTHQRVRKALNINGILMSHRESAMRFIFRSLRTLWQMSTQCSKDGDRGSDPARGVSLQTIGYVNGQVL
jgi:hypothetical protein